LGDRDDVPDKAATPTSFPREELLEMVKVVNEEMNRKEL
jgi:hypothetical protein